MPPASRWSAPPTDLRALVDQTVGEVAGLFEGSEVRLETSLEPVTAQVDRMRVGQVLANLLSNALKFTPPGAWCGVKLQADADWAGAAGDRLGPRHPRRRTAPRLRPVLARPRRSGRGAGSA
jgi:light-regulated signal transduction histidine kinase (bacteriophytochrome)